MGSNLLTLNWIDIYFQVWFAKTNLKSIMIVACSAFDWPYGLLSIHRKIGIFRLKVSWKYNLYNSSSYKARIQLILDVDDFNCWMFTDCYNGVMGVSTVKRGSFYKSSTGKLLSLTIEKMKTFFYRSCLTKKFNCGLMGIVPINQAQK